MALPTTEDIERERCRRDPARFLDRHAQVYDATLSAWLPFRLWDCQRDALALARSNRQTVALKARQIGWTWLFLGDYLHVVRFVPGSTLLIYSKTDEDAKDLLRRMRGMYDRLPDFLKLPGRQRKQDDSKHSWELGNGSRVLAFPTTRGDSYTATAVLLDEFDLTTHQDAVLGSVKPTIDAGGRLVLLSRADKSRPETPFKRIYREGRKEGSASGWRSLFAPWHARPGRDQAWYAAMRADVLARTGSLDELHEQYPETDAEALAPRSQDKRIPWTWLEPCYEEAEPLTREGFPALPSLTVFEPPVPGRRYVAGADPAEGNPNSDESATCFMDAETGRQVAVLAGLLDCSVFASQSAVVCRWYGGEGRHCPLLVERNNHGHAVLLWLRDNAKDVKLLSGKDGKPGWVSSTLGKSLMYDTTADAVRCEEVSVADFQTLTQLQSVEGSTLRAPEGQHDDRATAFALACLARLRKPQDYQPSQAPARTVVDSAPRGVYAR